MTHDHGHVHAPATYGTAFAVAVALNLGFVLVEAFYGWQSRSLALLADAGHNLSDVAGLLLAWAAVAAGHLPSTDRHTYGWRRASIMAGFLNAVILLVAMGSLGLEAIRRLTQPAEIAAGTVIVVAGIGVVINGLTAALFMAGSEHDLNLRGAFLHMAGDALVSAGVVAAALLYLWQGWAWIDPAMSLAIAVLIVLATWSLFRQTLHLMFDGVPDTIVLDSVRQALLNLRGVTELHDLHVWALATSENALTVHLVIDETRTSHDALLVAAEQMLKDRFAIRHVTLQVETQDHASHCSSGVCSM